MPICILLVPEAASQEAKLALMGRMSSHIHEAYPITTTHIFMHEGNGSNVMLAGSLVSALPHKDAEARGARVCFLICPPGAKADAKKTMMEKLTADISDVYPGPDDVFVIHREDEARQRDVEWSFAIGEPEVQADYSRMRTEGMGSEVAQ